MKKKTMYTALPIVIVIGILLIYLTSGGLAKKESEIVIFHTNDTHSRVEEGEYDGMGFARIATFLKEEKNNNPNVLLLDAGDTFHGQMFATLVKGESIARLMNKIGFDAMTAGNHDFDYGQDRLLELSKMIDFPIVVSNIKKSDGSSLFNPYIIKEVNGLKIGIFGLATPETSYKTHPKNVEGLEFINPVESAKEMVAELKDKTDIIIALAHIGLDESSNIRSDMIAEQVDGLDLIIDGHSHTAIENGLYISDTLIVSTGEYDKNLGKVVLNFKGNKLVSMKAKLISKEEAKDVKEDEEVAGLINEIKGEQKSILDEVVGKTSVILNGEREDVRAKETNMGNLIADIMVDLTGAKLAITNGGGIRASIDIGDITKEEVITVFPFGNYIVTKEFTGQQIKEALEHGVDSCPKPKGAFPQVSGITFTIDTEKPAGERVREIRIGSEVMVMDKKYLVATNDFLASGGDNFTMFKEAPIVNEYEGLDEALMQYLEKTGEISPTIEGRITILNNKTAEKINNLISMAIFPIFVYR